MKIIIVGCGNVGAILAEQLSNEGHDIVVLSDCKESRWLSYDCKSQQSCVQQGDFFLSKMK